MTYLELQARKSYINGCLKVCRAYGRTEQIKEYLTEKARVEAEMRNFNTE